MKKCLTYSQVFYFNIAEIKANMTEKMSSSHPLTQLDYFHPLSHFKVGRLYRQLYARVNHERMSLNLADVYKVTKHVNNTSQTITPCVNRLYFHPRREKKEKRKKNILPVGGKLIAAGSPKSHFCTNDKGVKTHK